MPHAPDVPARRRGWGPAWLLAVWGVSAPVLCLLYMKIEPAPDQAQFDYMGWLATQGLPFYAGSFDMNWPGAMVLHELAVRLSGGQPWSWHLFDFLLMQGTALSAALFLARAGFGVAPCILLVLYPPVYVTAGGWMAGQRDIVAMGALIGAGTAMLAPARREGRAMGLAGALVAGAVLIRPTYLSVLAGLVVLELLPRAWIGPPRRLPAARRIAALLAGFAGVAGGAVLAGLRAGNLTDFWQQSVLFTTAVYVGDPPQDMAGTARRLFLGDWLWLVVPALVGLALWIRRDRRLSLALMLLIGLGLAAGLSYAVQRKGFGYHLGGFLPLLAMLAAVAADLAGRSVGVRRWLGQGAVAALLLAGTGAALARHLPALADLRNGLQPLAGHYDLSADAQARILDIIRSRSGPGDRMVQYGTAYQIPYLARRLPAYRFITPAVGMMTPDFPLHAAWMAEIDTGLHRHRPKFVLITGTPLVWDQGRPRPAAGSGPVLEALLAYLETGHAVAFRDPSGTLFERIGD